MLPPASVFLFDIFYLAAFSPVLLFSTSSVAWWSWLINEDENQTNNRTSVRPGRGKQS